MRLAVGDFNKIIAKVNSFLLEVCILRYLDVAYFTDKLSIPLYLPIHVDRVGRMYNMGILNVVNSKFFRTCLISDSPEVNKTYNTKLFKDLYNFTNEKNVVDKDFLTNQKYLNLVEAPNVNRIIFLDATASMLQITALLFGDKKLACYSNLGADGPYDPVIELTKYWTIDENLPDPVQKLLASRSFLKHVIMLKLYGSQDFSNSMFFMRKEEPSAITYDDINLAVTNAA